MLFKIGFRLTCMLAALSGCDSGALPAADASKSDVADAGASDGGVVDVDGQDSAPVDSGTPVDPAKAAQVCDALDTFLLETGIPGGTVAVRFRDGSSHACYSGTANTDMSLPVAPGHRFRIGSVTKTFVGALTLLLVEDERLNLDDSLSEWVTGFDDSDPTVAQLLNHTSGVGEYVFDEVLRSDVRTHTEEELLVVARTKAPEFAPGTRFKYSNTNYLLLSVIATAAGEAHWSEQVRTRILEPLGIANTFVDGFEETPTTPVRGYERGGELTDVSDTFHQSMASGAGCMVSDASDLLRWSQGLYGGELLNEDSLRALTIENRVPYQDDSGISDSLDVGFSNFIETGDSEFGEVYGHSGGTPGFSSNLRYLARDGTAQVFILNAQATSDEAKNLTQALWVTLLVD